ncbi:hypothetical protein N5K55_02880 (plasmid) [Pseudomonas aeruginosa]|nr:hypothetical protein [Pseudomonas aeruginosa]
MQLRAAASGLLLALLAGQTVAASFDCSKASSFPEKEICRDGYLSGLDDWLAKSYKTALEVNPAQYEAVRQSQREWLDTRDACTDQKCLDKTIGARIQALDQYVTAERGKSASALAQAQLIKHQEEEAIRQRQTEERLATEEAARQTQIENQRQQAIIELQQRAQAAQAIESQRAIEHQQALSPNPAVPTTPTGCASFECNLVLAVIPRAGEISVAAVQIQPGLEVHAAGWCASDSLGDVEAPSGASNHLQRLHGCRNYEPLAGCRRGTGLLDELARAPRQLAMVAGLTGFMLALMFAVYASVRTNQGWLSISLSLIAKMTLVSVFYAVLGALVASLFVSTKYKGESQARANARNRREKKETMAMIAALTTAYTFLSAWLCRRQEFIPVSECLAFDSTASVA